MCAHQPNYIADCLLQRLYACRGWRHLNPHIYHLDQQHDAHLGLLFTRQALERPSPRVVRMPSKSLLWEVCWLLVLRSCCRKPMVDDIARKQCGKCKINAKLSEDYWDVSIVL